MPHVLHSDDCFVYVLHPLHTITRRMLRSTYAINRALDTHAVLLYSALPLLFYFITVYVVIRDGQYLSIVSNA